MTSTKAATVVHNPGPHVVVDLYALNDIARPLSPGHQEQPCKATATRRHRPPAPIRGDRSP
ncbi:hypothetical protein STRIP9103_03772 [Streptomyces ipomoeae 91-03]|uniref:Uncharacterized protein n=1 Tax=Streptomyces ipomoeae 91-03 TaxID=698759 RepID=L1L850_9ACTN|nr:hypothetical protein STRIP9103_03772 [Streptomyces ipomoeae 91-03]